MKTRLGLPRTHSHRLIVSLVFLLAFVLVGVAQHAYVRSSAESAVRAELTRFADAITQSIRIDDDWDLSIYENYPFQVPSWNLLTTGGTLLDVEGFFPGLLGSVSLPPDTAIDGISSMTSELHESYRVLARHMDNGVVLLGFPEPPPSDLSEEDLRKLADRTPRKLSDAAEYLYRHTSPEIDFAVISADGSLVKAGGRLPLRTDIHYVLDVISRGPPARLGGISVFFVARKLLDSKRRERGILIVPKEFGLVEGAIAAESRFNVLILAVVAVAWLALAVPPLVEIMRRRRIPIAKLVTEGESERLEFKSIATGGDERGVLRTVAAFLNSAGGTLLLGVGNDGAIQGIQGDLARFDGSRDKLELHLWNRISAQLGDHIRDLVRIRFSDELGWPICRIDVEEASEVVFLQEVEKRLSVYVRTGNRSTPLTGLEVNEYRRKHWRGRR